MNGSIPFFVPLILEVSVPASFLSNFRGKPVPQQRKFDFRCSEKWQFEIMLAGQQKHDVMHAL